MNKQFSFSEKLREIKKNGGEQSKKTSLLPLAGGAGNENT